MWKRITLSLIVGTLLSIVDGYYVISRQTSSISDWCVWPGGVQTIGAGPDCASLPSQSGQGWPFTAYFTVEDPRDTTDNFRRAVSFDVRLSRSGWIEDTLMLKYQDVDKVVLPLGYVLNSLIFSLPVFGLVSLARLAIHRHRAGSIQPTQGIK